ncbi:MAG: hypothetical protein ACOC00_00205, partial [Halothiobacillaceae bacterium]
VYRTSHDEKAQRLCMLGGTNEDLALLFGVGITTIERWMQKHESFRGAVKAGRSGADEEVARHLFLRATGYEHDDEKIFCSDGEVIRAATRKRYAPDTTAQIFWLKNRRPDLWRDRQEIEHSGTVDIAARIMEGRRQAGGGGSGD